MHSIPCCETPRTPAALPPAVLPRSIARISSSAGIQLSRGARIVPLLLAALLLAALLPVAPSNLQANVFDGGVPESWKVTVLARGLAGPVAVAPAPDGRVYVAERLTGRIRVIERGKLLPEPIATVEVIAAGERGLLGLCADPVVVIGEYGAETILYAYFTPGLDRARIARIRIPELVFDSTSSAGDPTAVEIETVIDDLPASSTHNGGALAFGADRHLYFSIGDLGIPSGTLPPASPSGRIHRVRLDGSVPEDNPWPGRTEFARGIRNCFGITVVPGRLPTVLYITDNGTSEGDEVNRVTAGAHLGWPDGTGTLGRSDRLDPLHTWSPTTAPVGIAYLDGSILPDGDAAGVLFGEYVTGRLVRLELDDDGDAVLDDEVFLERGNEPVYAIAVDASGGLWFTTGDTVGRIRPARLEWIRGDLDGNGRVNREDLTAMWGSLIHRSPLGCPAAADIDGNGNIDYADFVALLQYVSGDLVELPPPFQRCGDTPGNRLPCGQHPFCE